MRRRVSPPEIAARDACEGIHAVQARSVPCARVRANVRRRTTLGRRRSPAWTRACYAPRVRKTIVDPFGEGEPSTRPREKIQVIQDQRTSPVERDRSTLSNARVSPSVSVNEAGLKRFLCLVTRRDTSTEEEGESPASRVPSHRDARVNASGVLLVTMGSTMHATQEQLRAAKVDLAYRDFCAHLLIPLNDCRKANYFLPWRCGHERRVYEKCQYKECVERVVDEPRGRTCPSRPPLSRSKGTRASNGRAPLRSNPKTHDDDRQPTGARVRNERDPNARLSTHGAWFFFGSGATSFPAERDDLRD